jgi:P27 family predicted phage terminase small subunit
MGRRGPAPTPAKVKLLQGETRPSRVNFAEPVPSAEAPRMPSDMDPDAKVVWRRVVRNSPEGVIRSIDCEAVSRYAQASRLYAQSGPLLNTRAGVVKNPLHQIVREQAEAIRMFARELGLTPSARAGLHVEPERSFDAVAVDIGLPPRLRAVGGG